MFSTQSAAADVIGMEKLSSLATGITPPHILGYSPLPSLTPLWRTDEVASPNGNFQLKQEELWLNTLHPQFPAYIPYLKESEWPEPEINSTPLLLVVPQILFLSFFFSLPLLLKGMRRGAAVFKVCLLCLLAIDCLGNKFRILCAIPSLHERNPSLPQRYKCLYMHILFIKRVGAVPGNELIAVDQDFPSNCTITK